MNCFPRPRPAASAAACVVSANLRPPSESSMSGLIPTLTPRPPGPFGPAHAGGYKCPPGTQAQLRIFIHSLPPTRRGIPVRDHSVESCQRRRYPHRERSALGLCHPFEHHCAHQFGMGGRRGSQCVATGGVATGCDESARCVAPIFPAVRPHCRCLNRGYVPQSFSLGLLPPDLGHVSVIGALVGQSSRTHPPA